MNTQLQTTLIEQLQSGRQSNPALRTLINDYTKYHVVLIVVGGIVLLVSFVFAIRFWVLFKRVRKTRRFVWPFEKKVYFVFGSILTCFTLFFAIVWLANLSTVLKPLPGFTSLASSTAVPSDSVIGTSLTTWVQSGSDTLPPVLKERVQDRIGWQLPKAIICGILLPLFVVLSLRLWRKLLTARAQSDTKWTTKERLVFVGGVFAVAIALLLAIMFVANTQGALAPVAISLLGAGG